jgi:hypothetical protein
VRARGRNAPPCRLASSWYSILGWCSSVIKHDYLA